MAGLLRGLRDDRWFAAAAFLSVLLFVTCLSWTLLVPLRAVPNKVDAIVTFLPIPAFLLVWLILGHITHATAERSRKRLRQAFVALCAVTFVPNFYLSHERNFIRTRLIWRCNGEVTERYVSHNHAQLAIVVTGTDIVRMEGITKSFYDAVAVGDKVVKEPWSEYAMLNGSLTRILPPRGWSSILKGIDSIVIAQHGSNKAAGGNSGQAP